MKRFGRFLGTAGLCALIPFPALAQDAPVADVAEAAEESVIVVTAQRREELLQDVPLSITAIGEREVEVRQIDSLQDYAAIVPNFKAVDAGAPGRSDINIRGVGNIGGQASSIAVYLDGFGVSASGQSGFDLDVYDVERIEVLRGPQGTLFGRNTIAGAVNLILAKPRPVLDGGFTLEASSYNTVLAQGFVNLPVVSDVLSARASVTYGYSDGYIIDRGPAGNSDSHQRYSARGAVRLDSGPMTVDVTVINGKDNQGIVRSLPTGVVTNPVRFTVGLEAGLDPLSIGFFPDNRRSIATDAQQFNRRDYTTAIVNTAYDFGGATAIVLGGIQDTEVSAAGDFDRTVLNAVTQVSNQTSRLESVEVRIQSNDDEERQFSWLIGGAYNRDRVNEASITTFQEDLFALIGLPTFLAPFRLSDLQTRLRVHTIAAFGSLEWRSPDRRWVISASARYTDDKLDGRYIDNSQAFGTGIPADIDIVQSESFNDLTPRLSVRFEPSTRITVYATVSRGYKAGGFNPGAQDVPGSPAVYGKESAYNYEMGARFVSPGNRFSLSGAVFKMDWNDIQVNALYRGPDLIARNFTQNAASASIKGFELEAGVRPFAGLNLGASVGYNDGRFDDFPTAIDDDGNVFDASGNRLPNASKWNVSAYGEYGFDLGSAGQLFARGEYIYASDFYQTTQRRRDVGYFVPEMGYFNVRAGYRGRNFSVSGFAENLGASGNVVAYEVNNFLSGIQAIIRPERYGLRVGCNF